MGTTWVLAVARAGRVEKGAITLTLVVDHFDRCKRWFSKPEAKISQKGAQSVSCKGEKEREVEKRRKERYQNIKYQMCVWKGQKSHAKE